MSSVQEFIRELSIILPEGKFKVNELSTILSKIRNNSIRSRINDYFTALLNTASPENELWEKFRDEFYLIIGCQPKVTEFTVKELAGRKDRIDFMFECADGFPIWIDLKKLYYYDKKNDTYRKEELSHQKWKDKAAKYIKLISDWMIKKGEPHQKLKRIVIIYTNLDTWIIYSYLQYSLEGELRPLAIFGLEELWDEIQKIGSFSDLLRKILRLYGKAELSDRFYSDLQKWVHKIISSNIFEGNELKIKEQAVLLINKLIMAETLADIGVIASGKLKRTWFDKKEDWLPKGKSRVVEEFLKDLDEWFYDYYDTELFLPGTLQIRDWDALYEVLEDLIEGRAGATPITAYNYDLMDEDVLGAAYERFLAGKKKEKGAYYTPAYISEYLIGRTVRRVFEDALEKIREACTESPDLSQVKDLVKEFLSIKIVDPACGSGSFLVKALKEIVGLYEELRKVLDCIESKILDGNTTLERSFRPEELDEIYDMIGFNGPNVKLNSLMILRHIYGVDKDHRALEIAKVNLWLSILKLKPKDYRPESIGGLRYVMPDLRLNLRGGDSLVGFLREEFAIGILSNHRDKLQKLSELRRKYLENPLDPSPLDEAERILKELKSKLDEELSSYIKELPEMNRFLSENPPMHWIVDFWHAFLRDDCTYDPNRGFHVVVGNPPYVRIQNMRKLDERYVDYLNLFYKEVTTGNYDLAVPFIVRGYFLLRKDGFLSYIVTQRWLKEDYGRGLRKFLSERKCVERIVDFGDQMVFPVDSYTILLFLRRDRKIDDVEYCLIDDIDRVKRDMDSIERALSGARIAGIKEAFTQPSDDFNDDPWIFLNEKERKIFKKLASVGKLRDFAEIFVGLQTSADKVYVLDIIADKDVTLKVKSRATMKEYELESDLLKPLLKGEDIERWTVTSYSQVLLFPYIIEGGKAVLIDEETLKSRYPKVWSYLNDVVEVKGRNGETRKISVKEILLGRSDVKRGEWWGYPYKKNLERFDDPKIMTKVLANRSSFALDEDGSFYFVGGGNAGVYGISPRNEKHRYYLLALLNSSLLEWYLRKTSIVFRGGFYSYAKRFIENLPIIIPDDDKLESISKEVREVIELTRKSQELKRKWDAKIRASGRVRTISIIDAINKWNLGTSPTFITAFLKHLENTRDAVLKDRTIILLDKNGSVKRRLPQPTKGDAEANFQIIRGLLEKKFKILPGDECIRIVSDSLTIEIKGEDELVDHIYLSALWAMRHKRLNDIRELFLQKCVPNFGSVRKLKEKYKEEIGEIVYKVDHLISKKESSIDSEVYEIYGISSLVT